MSESPADETLVRRIQSGDSHAFSLLVERHTERFYALAFRFLGSRDHAEDIVQDAFLKLWADPTVWQAGRGAKFTTWFYRIVSNRCLDELRRRKPGAAIDIDALADSQPLAETELQTRQQQQRLERAIRQLPERQQAALNLCFYEELNQKEAAEILQVSIKALESLLMRAKYTLKDKLAEKKEAI